MTAREKIERLTHSWYGFDLFAAGVGLLMNGLGIFSLIWAGMSLAFSFGVTYVLGRKLQNRSSFTRSALIVLSTIFTVLGVIGVVLGVMHFELSLRFVLRGVLLVSGLSMHLKSLAVLTDRQVKSYFA